jgi:hypothetical protein
MKKLYLFLGILSLVIAAGLLYANLALPPESLMLMVGDRNMPWLGPIIFIVFGVGLLVLASYSQRKEVETAGQPKPVVSVDPEKAALNKRLESVFWGIFLIMLAGWWLIPDNVAPKAVWDIGVGVLFLGLNAARYFSKIRMSGFTTFLGVISVLGGIIELLGWVNLDGALLLIVLGAYLILKPWFDRQRLFGKAEER